MKNAQSPNAPRAEYTAWLLKSCGSLAFVALAFATPAFAGVVAQNEAVDYNMGSTAGTAADPSVYVFDNYVKDFGSTRIYVGHGVSGANWNRLEIRNGAQVKTTSGIIRIGSDKDDYTNTCNSCVVTGADSSFSTGGGRLGGKSPGNSLIVKDGGTVNLNGHFICGFDDRPFVTNNTIVVDAGTVNLIGAGTRLRMGYGTGHDHNTVVVRNGGVIAGATGLVGIRNGKYCDYRVEGEGSRIELGYAGTSFTLGENPICHHNTLTLVDDGLVKLTSPSGGLSITVDASQGGSGVRFAKGVFALAGNKPTHIPYGKAWLWDGASWAPAPVGWKGTYYADEAAAATAGFAGFGGYTVFTGGESMIAASRRTLILMM